MDLLDHQLLREMDKIDCPIMKEAARQLRVLGRRVEELHLDNKKLRLKTSSAKIIQFPVVKRR